MSARVGVVDFGAGNLQSVMHSLRRAGAEPWMVHGPDELRDAERVVLPGVGELRTCMQRLDERGLAEGLREYLADSGRPLLGVCLGLQLLADGGSEGGGADALGVVPGWVVKFPERGREIDGRRLKVPHMGWTAVRQRPHPCWDGIADGSRFYFVHSYHLPPPQQEDNGHWRVTALAEHGVPFTAGIAGDGFFAVQFHPEKSAADGLRVYANFLQWRP